eukprot:evm.model.scf_1068.2 EVM.evm.TU.scf_1068.2   scf_1068:11561-13841(-)
MRWYWRPSPCYLDHNHPTADLCVSQLAEMWSWLIPITIWLTSVPQQPMTTVQAVCLCALIVHYVHRSVIYQWMAPAQGTPILVLLHAFVFTCWNGFIQGWSIVHHWTITVADSWLAWLGISVWLLGFCMNLQGDYTLIGLRKQNDKGYRVPHGGLFEYVSAANYFGEIVEWLGFALACRSLAAASFAIFSFCYLAKRGVAYHSWYLSKIKGYPRNRKAVIPFIL